MKRDEELNKTPEGYTVFGSEKEFFTQWELDNQQSYEKPVIAQILCAKRTKYGSISLFVDLPTGNKTNIYLYPAQLKALGIELAISPVIRKTPKGIEAIEGYEVDESDESLKTKLYGKRAVLSMIDKRYLITEIF